MLALLERDSFVRSARELHSTANRITNTIVALPTPLSSNSSQAEIAQLELSRRMAKDALDASPYAELRKLACSVRNGGVMISGRVSTYYLKQIAQATVKRVTLDRSIENQVEVNSHRAPSAQRWTR